MYFESRAQAGRILAAQLYDRYRYENCVVVALSNGAVEVGEQIAEVLHCAMTMIIIEDIPVPGENVSFGGLSQDGSFTYNSDFSSGEIQEYVSEFYNYLEEQKREAFQRTNRLLGDGGVIDKDMLRDHTIILVADGLDNATSLDVAANFLKPIRIQRLVIATPVASIPVVDKMHMIGDELHVLDVKENFMGIDHYYDNNDIPEREEVVAKINQTILNWQ